MRTITSLMYNKLAVQASEAANLGLNKVAEALDNCLEVSVRPDGELYSYAQDEIQADVEKNIWQAMIRTADYYGSTFDAANMQKVVEKLAANLMEEVRKDVGNTSGVGAYEPTVPGEHREHITVEAIEE